MARLCRLKSWRGCRARIFRNIKRFGTVGYSDLAERVIYLTREGKFREKRIGRMTMPELDYWIRHVDGYIRELNKRLSSQ